MKKNFKKNKGFIQHQSAGWRIGAGFTLIEVLIAVGLFTVLMVIGIGSVLAVNASHKRVQTMREIMTNLNFIMDDMSRNIRTGSSLRCDEEYTEFGPRPCDQAMGGNTRIISSLFITLEPPGGDPDNPDDQWTYKISPDRCDGQSRPCKLTKATMVLPDGTRPTFDLTPTSISIDPARSGFVFLNQSLINIRLSGKITEKGSSTPFNLQTTVSNRNQ